MTEICASGEVAELLGALTSEDRKWLEAMGWPGWHRWKQGGLIGECTCCDICDSCSHDFGLLM